LKLGLDTKQTCNILKLLVTFVLFTCHMLKETSWIEKLNQEYSLDTTVHPKPKKFSNHEMRKL
jgi:hypothetical protein